MSADHQDAPTESETPEAPKPKIIKRYSNRKLYDTDRSKYVTLEEIARMIKAGEEITIIDNETKEDLTSVTLTQIIYEEEKRESRMPLGMLRKLIQTSGGSLQDFFDRSVKTPVVEIRDKAEKSVEKSVEELVQSAANIREAATRGVTELTDSARRIFSRDERRAEEFKKTAVALLDHIDNRMDERLEEVKTTLQEDTEAPANDAPVPEAAEGEDPKPVAPRPLVERLAIDEHVALLRERLDNLHSKVTALEKLAEEHRSNPPSETSEASDPQPHDAS